MTSLRNIDQILGLADDGAYLPDLIDRFEAANVEMRQFAQDYGKAKVGLGLKIELEIDRFGQVSITIDDKITTSQPPKRRSVGWLTGNGGLTAENPAQTRMQIRDTGNGIRELRTAQPMSQEQ